MNEGSEFKKLLDEIYFDNYMLKLFILDNNLIGDFNEFINEKTAKFKVFDSGEVK
jgi:hypothetical protein